MLFVWPCDQAEHERRLETVLKGLEQKYLNFE
jgi:hypothetical protein